MTKPDWNGVEVELTVSQTVRYKVHSDSYPEARTLGEAMEIDVVDANVDPEYLAGMDLVAIETSWRKV